MPPNATPGVERPAIFISYSRKDKQWLEALLTMLSPMVRTGAAHVWWDGEIKPSQQWRQEIEAALDSARVAVLLISNNFIGSKFMIAEGLPYLLEAARQRRVKVLWALLAPCLYKLTPLKNLQAIYDPSRPLNSLRRFARDAAWQVICQRIAGAIDAPNSRIAELETFSETVPQVDLEARPEVRIAELVKVPELPAAEVVIASPVNFTFHFTAKKPREVFISYAWGDETPEGKVRAKAAEALYSALEKDGFLPVRDRDQIRPGERISTFLRDLTRADLVVAVISDKYLRSSYCMYEIYKLWQRSQGDADTLAQCLVPIVLPEVKIGNLPERVPYLRYWAEQAKSLEALIRDPDIRPSSKSWEQVRLVREFAHNVDDILDFLQDVLMPRNLEANLDDGFEAMREALLRRLGSV